MEPSWQVCPDQWGPQGPLCYNGTTGAVDACSSLKKYKENIKPLDVGLKELMELNPVSYQWKDSKEKEIGFIAEDVAAVEPRLKLLSTEKKLTGVKYDKMSSWIVKSVQELYKKLLTNDNEIETLKQENRELKEALCEINPKANICRVSKN